MKNGIHPNANLSKLKKLLGANFRYRLDPKAATQEERDEAREKARDDYRNALLQGDQKHQELVAAAKDAKERAGRLIARSRSYKITAGTVDQAGSFGFFSVRAEGDTWAQIVEKLDRTDRRA
jgi:hypothetical protein